MRFSAFCKYSLSVFSVCVWTLSDATVIAVLSRLFFIKINLTCCSDGKQSSTVVMTFVCPCLAASCITVSSLFCTMRSSNFCSDVRQSKILFTDCVWPKPAATCNGAHLSLSSRLSLFTGCMDLMSVVIISVSSRLAAHHSAVLLGIYSCCSIVILWMSSGILLSSLLSLNTSG